MFIDRYNNKIKSVLQKKRLKHEQTEVTEQSQTRNDQSEQQSTHMLLDTVSVIQNKQTSTVTTALEASDTKTSDHTVKEPEEPKTATV